MSTLILTAVAMIAFAGNSVLCRLALAEEAIDAGSFTLIRLVTGAITLGVILFFRAGGDRATYPGLKFTLLAGTALFSYAVLFSFAYTQLSAGTGALLLFGSVQLSLLGLHWWQGQHFRGLEIVGIICSLGGFVWLMLPSASQPNLFSAILMLSSGVAWAMFTALGKTINSPVSGITWGFISASALSILCIPWMLSNATVSAEGVILATLSGSITSAMGYVLWYRVLKQLTLLQASISQLSVPVITLILGVILLSEVISIREVITSVVILGGIALVFVSRWNKNSGNA
ncbi:DMT family transporter [Vibrio japonicus]|uniref:DMT family transporter n=1 Tax=Vibrio japonicus TaxID=1824638 RepID=A0ABY5LKV6_9VIBR|nr:DMT family transporter [Vibrio japonicus]UUM32754.1 DMT family transporter [Vibrio japonicus]